MSKVCSPTSFANVLAAVLCIAFPIAMFTAENGDKVTYDGGSLPDTKAGSGMKVYIESNQVRLAKDNADVVKIPASAITEISYGQDVHRRIGTALAVGVFTLGVGALIALTKSKKHYIGLIWADGDKKGGLALQCDKNASRLVFTTLLMPRKVNDRSTEYANDDANGCRLRAAHKISDTCTCNRHKYRNPISSIHACS